MIVVIPSLILVPNLPAPFPPELVLEPTSGAGPGETPSTPCVNLLQRVRGGIRLAIRSSSAAPSTAVAMMASFIMESAEIMRALALVQPAAQQGISWMGNLIGVARTFQFEGGSRRLHRRAQDLPSATDANSLRHCAAAPERRLAARASAAEQLVAARSMNALRTTHLALRPPPPCGTQHYGCIIPTTALDRGRRQGSVGTSKPWGAPLELTVLAVRAMRAAAVPPIQLSTLRADVRNPFTAQVRTWQRRRCTQLVGRLICLGREVLETSTEESAELQRQVKTLKFTLGCMRGEFNSLLVLAAAPLGTLEAPRKLVRAGMGATSLLAVRACRSPPRPRWRPARSHGTPLSLASRLRVAAS